MLIEIKFKSMHSVHKHTHIHIHTYKYSCNYTSNSYWLNPFVGQAIDFVCADFIANIDRIARVRKGGKVRPQDSLWITMHSSSRQVCFAKSFFKTHFDCSVKEPFFLPQGKSQMFFNIRYIPTYIHMYW